MSRVKRRLTVDPDGAPANAAHGRAGGQPDAGFRHAYRWRSGTCRHAYRRMVVSAPDDDAAGDPVPVDARGRPALSDRPRRYLAPGNVVLHRRTAPVMLQALYRTRRAATLYRNVVLQRHTATSSRVDALRFAGVRGPSSRPRTPASATHIARRWR